MLTKGDADTLAEPENDSLGLSVPLTLKAALGVKLTSEEGDSIDDLEPMGDSVNTPELL